MSTFGLPGCSGLQTTGGNAGIANQYANLAALYAAKGSLSNGDQWELLDTGRTGIISSTLGIDGLFPHPFEQGMYPINSTTMSFGALADGKILKAQNGNYVTLETTCLKLALDTGDAELADIFLPGLVARPGVMSCSFKFVSGTPGANQNFVWYWVRSSTLTPATMDAHGGYIQYDAAGNHFCRPITYDGGSASVGTGESAAFVNATSWIDVYSRREGSAGAYYIVDAAAGLDGATASAMADELAANNGMDLSSGTEAFYSALRMTPSSATDWYCEVYSIGLSRLWNGAAE